MLHRIAIHSNFEAFFQPTRAALIAMSFVDLAQSIGLRLAHVLAIPPDASLEKARASVARVDAVVLTGAVIATDLARYIVENPAWKRKK